MKKWMILFCSLSLVSTAFTANAQSKCYKAQNTNSINHVKSWSMALENLPGTHYIKHNYTTSTPKNLTTAYQNPQIRDAFILYGKSPTSIGGKRVIINNSNTSNIGDSLDYLICTNPFNIPWDTNYCATSTGTPTPWQSAVFSFSSEQRRNYSSLSGTNFDSYSYAVSIPSYGFYLNDNSDLAQAYSYPNGIQTINQYALRPALMTYHDITVENKMAKTQNSFYYQMDINEDYLIDFGLYDDDGDSLAVELIDLPAIKLRSGMDYDTSNLWIDSLTTMPFVAGYNKLHPFPNNAFTLDPVNHQILVKPNAEGLYNFGIRVNEYRGGKLIAYADKIVGVFVENTVKKQPYISGPENISSGVNQIGTSNKLYACKNTTVQFDIHMKKYNGTSGLTDYAIDFTGFGANSPTYSVLYNNNIDSMVFRFTYSGDNPDQIWRYINIYQYDTTCIPEKGMMAESSQTVGIFIFDQPNLQLGNSAICAGDTIQLSTGSSFYYTIPIAGDYGSLSCYSCASPLAYPDETTTYVTYPFMGSQICNISDTFKIEVVEKFDLKIDADSFLCTSILKIPLKSKADPNLSGLNYQWSPLAQCTPNNTANTELQILSDTTWVTVRAWDGAGCHESMDSLMVVNSPNFNPGATVAPLAICEGDTIHGQAWGGNRYKWECPAGAIICDTCAETDMVPLVTSKIDVEIWDSLGCYWSDDFKVIVSPVPVPNAGMDTTIYDGAVFSLNGSRSREYSTAQWAPGEYLYDDLSIITEGMYVPTDTNFILFLQNGICQATDTVRVFVIPCILYPIPNVFEPDGHAWVNRFKPNMRDPDTYIKMQIYNRWGNQVYEESGKASDFRGWDGRINGEMQPIANYVWVIEVDCTRLDGTPGHTKLTGTVLLMK